MASVLLFSLFARTSFGSVCGFSLFSVVCLSPSVKTPVFVDTNSLFVSTLFLSVSIIFSASDLKELTRTFETKGS